MKVKSLQQVSVFMIVVLLFMGAGQTLYAQDGTNDSLKQNFRLFEDDKILDICLRFDLSTYFKTKPQENYLSANLTFNPGKSDSISRDIRLKTRGVFRNKYCMYPPIELNIKKADFGFRDLKKISKLKLVVQCSQGKSNEDYILREYLAYKLFNVLTDTSFRVRLLSISYIDSKNSKKPVKQYGFFIEPADVLARRVNSFLVKSATLTQKAIIPGIMDRMAIFNYMIGNYDWSIPGQHNVLIIKAPVVDPFGRGIAIPHDFDWTGLVNASYAIPAENIGTENVRDRVFTGVCRNKDVYLRELDEFAAKKAEFYKVINDFPYLNQYAKKDMTRYLDEFFDQLAGKRELIIYTFMNSCIKI